MVAGTVNALVQLSDSRLQGWSRAAPEAWPHKAISVYETDQSFPTMTTGRHRSHPRVPQRGQGPRPHHPEAVRKYLIGKNRDWAIEDYGSGTLIHKWQRHRHAERLAAMR